MNEKIVIAVAAIVAGFWLGQAYETEKARKTALKLLGILLASTTCA